MATARYTCLGDWLRWMETLHPSEIDLSLGRISKVAKKLHLLNIDSRVISVAGTNGKGSFVCALSALLQNDGANVGAYTSPHILHYNERIAINGVAVSDDDICEAFTAIDEARESATLTYFEFGTLAALYLFKRANLDYVILEVGLGGRLDAVNIIDSDIAVITSIALDHEAWLGTDREMIGREKAGILRAGSPFVCVDANPPESVIHTADSLMCHSLYRNADISLSESDGTLTLQCLDKKGDATSYILSQYHLPAASLLAAVQAYSLLSGCLRYDSIVSVMENVQLAGRFETITFDGQHYILDVGHNPEAADELRKNIQRKKLRDVVVVFAAMQDKDIVGIVSGLKSLVSTWVCTEIPELARSIDADTLSQTLKNEGLNTLVAKTPNDALTLAKKVNVERYSSRNTILVTGSFFLVAEAKKALIHQRDTL